MTDRLLRLAEVERMVSHDGATIYRWLAVGKFPEPRRTGPNSVRWRESDVMAWIDQLPASSDQSKQPPRAA